MRRLPGTEPGYARFELERRSDGLWKVHYSHAEGRGFLAGTLDTFDELTLEEALDVMGAILDGFAG